MRRRLQIKHVSRMRAVWVPTVGCFSVRLRSTRDIYLSPPGFRAASAFFWNADGMQELLQRGGADRYAAFAVCCCGTPGALSVQERAIPEQHN
jgi:hypothetical protein